MKRKEDIHPFVKAFQAGQKADQLGELFDLFFTKEELKVLESRCKIIKALLKSEMTQREIASKYHVSIAQITRGSNALKSISSQLKDVLNSLSW